MHKGHIYHTQALWLIMLIRRATSLKWPFRDFRRNIHKEREERRCEKWVDGDMSYLGRGRVAHNGGEHSNGVYCDAVRALFPDLHTHAKYTHHLVHNLHIISYVKWLVHPRINILSLFKQTNVFPNPIWRTKAVTFLNVTRKQKRI